MANIMRELITTDPRLQGAAGTGDDKKPYSDGYDCQSIVGGDEVGGAFGDHHRRDMRVRPGDRRHD